MKKQNVDEMGLLGQTGVDEMGLLRKFVDQMGVDEMGVDQMGCYLLPYYYVPKAPCTLSSY